MKHLLILLLSLFVVTSYAQSDSIPSNKNIIYAEFGGNSIIYSVNYERIFYKKNKFQFSARIGFGNFPLNSSIYSEPNQWELITQNSMFVIPMEAMFAFGKKKGKFELGLGYTHLISESTSIHVDLNNNNSLRSTVYYHPIVGLSCLYRLEDTQSGFFLKSGLTGIAIFSTDPMGIGLPSVMVLPMPKLVIGYKFKRCR